MHNNRHLLPLLGLFFTLATGCYGQQLPLDPAVRTGKLANGFTYYIRHNTEPKNRVVFYLANKIGSMQEDEDQRGLAHFMEHMSFNGTRHYPKNKLVEYLQKSGVRFGADLNAYTAFNETVYQLPLPCDDTSIVRNGLQIMRDWAAEATLETEEIDKERGVVLEEKRMHNGAGQRLQEKSFSMLVNGSRYAHREPIGTEEVLKNFTPAVVKRFYKDWYRPNQQALIVVGDIDVNSMEQQVKKLFGDLKNPAKERPVLPYNIPLSGKNQFLALTDHEQTATEISVLIKMTELSLKTTADYRVSIVRNLVNYVLAARLQELSTQPESPFVSADAGVSGFMGGLDAFKVSIAPKPGKIKEAFTTVWKEIVRIQQNGITGNELERSNLSYISQMENVYKERSKNPSKSYVQEYLQLYLHGIAAPGIEKEYALAKEYSSNISIEEVNGCIRTILKDKDRDIIIVAPEKDKDALPDQAQVNAWITTISADKLAQWKEEAPVNGLMTTMPAPGKVINRDRADSLGVTILTLSNGVKVWLKPTQFKNEEIVFGAFSEGGTSLYPDSMYMNASGAANLVAANGLGAFTPVDLSKMLAGKSVQVQPYIQERYEGINGSATPKDLETALQLTWLYFTKPRNDASLFSNNISRMKAGMANRGNSPDAAFSDTASVVLGGYHYRRQPLTAERLDSIDADKAYAIYKERFANAADFTFVFTGSIDTTTFIPLIERYLGSLPAGGEKETAKDLGIHIPEGQINKIVSKGKDNKAVVRLLYSGTYSFSEANNIQLTALGTVLQYRMTERIRELEGGAYSPRAGASYNKLPQSRYGISIQFICAPGNVEKLVAAVNDEISKIKNGGVTADDISKFTAEQTRTTELKLQNNQFWLGYLMYALQNNEPPIGIFQFKEVLKTVTPKTVQQAAQQYISDNNCVRLVLQPESN